MLALTARTTGPEMEPIVTTSSSARQILRSSSIIGGGAVLNILIGLARTKVVALLLGPAGVGMVGIFQSLASTGAAAGGMGIASSGVRQIAEGVAADDQTALTHTRQALFRGSALLAVIIAAVFWLLRHSIAAYVLGDPGQADVLGWIGVAAALTIVSNAQGALLNGFRHIGDLARMNVLGALLGTVLGIGVLLVWRERALVAYVVIAPLALVIAGAILARRVPPPRAGVMRNNRISWILLFKLGFSFMAASLAGTLMLLVVRSIVGQRLGAGPLGEFSAAWMISMTYIGFVLSAMAADYYPRLTAAIKDDTEVNRMVNEQSEIALLLAAPVLIGMQAAAPWVIRLLYSSQFDGAVDVLRWQIMGDTLKIIGWPLGFVLLAAGRGRMFLFVEVAEAAFFCAFVWLTIDQAGLASTGMGFLLMYAIYVPVSYLLARRQTGFRWTPKVTRIGLGSTAAVALTGACGAASDLLGFAVGLIIATAIGIYSAIRLDDLGIFQGKMAPIRSIVTSIKFILPSYFHP
jgi:O-antigen/teichoic acid export membrane protein